jgi:hypothetical protein
MEAINEVVGAKTLPPYMKGGGESSRSLVPAESARCAMWWWLLDFVPGPAVSFTQPLLTLADNTI